MSLEKFEKQIDEEERGFHIILKKTKDEHEKEMKIMQTKLSFRIEALEIALNEVKLQKNEELERVNHYLAEHESWRLN